MDNMERAREVWREALKKALYSGGARYESEAAARVIAEALARERAEGRAQGIEEAAKEPAAWLYERHNPWPQTPKVEYYTSRERLPNRRQNGWTETPLYTLAHPNA